METKRSGKFSSDPTTIDNHIEILDDVLKLFWADMPEEDRDGWAEYVQGRVKIIMGE